MIFNLHNVELIIQPNILNMKMDLRQPLHCFLDLWSSIFNSANPLFSRLEWKMRSICLDICWSLRPQLNHSSMLLGPMNQHCATKPHCIKSLWKWKYLISTAFRVDFHIASVPEDSTMLLKLTAASYESLGETNWSGNAQVKRATLYTLDRVAVSMCTLYQTNITLENSTLFLNYTLSSGT